MALAVMTIFFSQFLLHKLFLNNPEFLHRSIFPIGVKNVKIP